MKLSKGALVALGLFLIAVLFTSVSVWQTLSPPVSGRTASYTVEFPNVTSLKAGDDVTLAGVRVGKVTGTGWERQDDGTVHAVVTFDFERDVELSQNATAQVKFKDMLGVRYMGITDPGGAPPLDRGGRLGAREGEPTKLGTPPTDVTQLFNGFRPVFRLLEPERLNDLTASLISALDGNTDVFEATLVGVLDVANVMLQRQAEIEQIANTLPDAMNVVVERREDVEAAITGLTDLTTKLAERNNDIIALLDDGGSAMAKFANLLNTTMPDLKRAVTAATNVSESWSQRNPEFTQFLESLNRAAVSVNHYGEYGSWLNIYICNLTLRAGGINPGPGVFGGTHSEVCR